MTLEDKYVVRHIYGDRQAELHLFDKATEKRVAVFTGPNARGLAESWHAAVPSTAQPTADSPAPNIHPDATSAGPPPPAVDFRYAGGVSSDNSSTNSGWSTGAAIVGVGGVSRKPQAARKGNAPKGTRP